MIWTNLYNNNAGEIKHKFLSKSICVRENFESNNVIGMNCYYLYKQLFSLLLRTLVDHYLFELLNSEALFNRAIYNIAGIILASLLDITVVLNHYM